MKTRIFFLLLGLSLTAAFWFACERNSDPEPLSVTTKYDMICKGSGILKTNDPPSETSCINYSFDGDSLLTMMHYNAGFNCCPEGFAVDIEVKGDSLIIREDDLKHLCRCNCLYDLEIEVHNLPVGSYHVRIVESYAGYSWAPLVFDLDLKKEPTGKFCTTRTEGWWR